MAVRFVAPRVPLVDVQTGQITREWFLFLQGFFPSQSSSAADDITVGVNPEVTALRDDISELRKMLDDVRKGLVVL
jgi:hypothetical protein